LGVSSVTGQRAVSHSISGGSGARWCPRRNIASVLLVTTRCRGGPCAGHVGDGEFPRGRSAQGRAPALSTSGHSKPVRSSQELPGVEHSSRCSRREARSASRRPRAWGVRAGPAAVPRSLRRVSETGAAASRMPALPLRGRRAQRGQFKYITGSAAAYFSPPRLSAGVAPSERPTPSRRTASRPGAVSWGEGGCAKARRCTMTEPWILSPEPRPGQVGRSLAAAAASPPACHRPVSGREADLVGSSTDPPGSKTTPRAALARTSPAARTWSHRWRSHGGRRERPAVLLAPGVPRGTDGSSNLRGWGGPIGGSRRRPRAPPALFSASPPVQCVPRDQSGCARSEFPRRLAGGVPASGSSADFTVIRAIAVSFVECPRRRFLPRRGGGGG